MIMNRIVTRRIMVLQPGYLPWLGFFDMLYKSEALVYHTDLQYDKCSWRNRNRIRTKDGWAWLSVPVYIKGHSKDKILDIKIDNTKKWRKRHMNLVTENYKNAPFFERYIGNFEDIIKKDWDFLVDLDFALINWLMDELHLKKKLIYSHDLSLNGQRSTYRLIKICKQLGADTYLSGSRGRNYIDDSMFMDEGLKLEYHDYVHPEYKQQFDGFVPYMSVIDLLFNHGDASLKILTGNYGEKS